MKNWGSLARLFIELNLEKSGTEEGSVQRILLVVHRNRALCGPLKIRAFEFFFLFLMNSFRVFFYKKKIIF